MTDLKSLCEHVLKEAEAFHSIHRSPPLTAERLAKACFVFIEAVDILYRTGAIDPLVNAEIHKAIDGVTKGDK